ncbi:hypothetical protein CISG_01834 [Coccidioides immitis RMSCC 3703]|uniref:Uncharacterized protein n=2 Tax=Coccidioides immitis TaxID=5501 RepID=A0A0J8R0W6_COCIT|nr:hypothetical protein CIRG_08478 [Coccidioides immitis RMSCC 2394]KMU78794.1 hypothetical protein CISG_01834 [Coccidioides immitis RMSCC 3703]
MSPQRFLNFSIPPRIRTQGGELPVLPFPDPTAKCILGYSADRDRFRSGGRCQAHVYLAFEVLRRTKALDLELMPRASVVMIHESGPPGDSRYRPVVLDGLNFSFQFRAKRIEESRESAFAEFDGPFQQRLRGAILRAILMGSSGLVSRRKTEQNWTAKSQEPSQDVELSMRLGAGGLVDPSRCEEVDVLASWRHLPPDQ